MEKKLFNELVESVREGGAILRGEAAPSRVFHHDASLTLRNPLKQFAICLETDDPQLLIPRKIYEVTLSGDALVTVTDEAGEAAIYPADYFILINLPREVEKALLSAA